MENKDNIIWENVNSEGYLFEMGQVYPIGKSGQFNILIGFTPEEYKGNAYFKVYNHPTRYQSATKVIRINFKTPTVVTGHRERNGKQEWELEDFGINERKQLIEYLNSKSQLNTNITVWSELRFQWNKMKNISMESISDYINGKYDTTENLSNPDYIPYNMQMPNYMNLTK